MSGFHGVVDGRVRIGSSERMAVKDFTRFRAAALEIHDDRALPDDLLIRGDFFRRELRQGLTVYCGHATEQYAFTATTTLDVGLTCAFVMDGEISLKVGDRQFAVKGGGGSRLVDALALLSIVREPFQRITTRPQQVRHLAVTATPEWLGQEDLEPLEHLYGSRQWADPMSRSCQWRPSPRLHRLIEEVVRPSLIRSELLNLYLECRVVEIVLETLSAMIRDDGAANARLTLTRHERIRLQRAREFIAARLSDPLTVSGIAHAAGISASGLQKLFHRAEGVGVFEYVRDLRMNQAFIALRSGNVSVHQASEVAGYASPANFATAFRKRFGMTPREAARG